MEGIKSEFSNENAEIFQNITDLDSIDTFLKNISEEELYKTFLSENSSFHISTPILTTNNRIQTVEKETSKQFVLLTPKKEYSLELNEPKSFSSRANKKQRITTDNKTIPKIVNERHQKRLVANKRSAQASRERKKQLKALLEERVIGLTKENSHLTISIAQLETENKVLKNEFIQLQNLIDESTSMSKFAARSQFNPNSIKSTVPSSPLAVALYIMVVLNSFGNYFSTIPLQKQIVNQSPFVNSAIVT